MTACGVDGAPIRVVIVDDHPALREGTASLLSREPDIDVVTILGTLGELRALLRGAERPDVVVLDIRLGDERGLDLLGDAASDGSKRPAIVIWTAYDFPQYAAFAFRAGAAGFVLKTAPTSELIQTIRHAAQGAVHFGSRPDLASKPLSGREHDVLTHLVAGLSNDEIAARLSITTRTVEAHLTRVYERFDVRSRAELAARAIGEGWLDVPPGGPPGAYRRA